MLIGKPTRSAGKFDQFWFMFSDGADFENVKVVAWTGVAQKKRSVFD